MVGLVLGFWVVGDGGRLEVFDKTSVTRILGKYMHCISLKYASCCCGCGEVHRERVKTIKL